MSLIYNSMSFKIIFITNLDFIRLGYLCNTSDVVKSSNVIYVIPRNTWIIRNFLAYLNMV